MFILSTYYIMTKSIYNIYSTNTYIKLQTQGGAIAQLMFMLLRGQVECGMMCIDDI